MGAARSRPAIRSVSLTEAAEAAVALADVDDAEDLEDARSAREPHAGNDICAIPDPDVVRDAPATGIGDEDLACTGRANGRPDRRDRRPGLGGAAGAVRHADRGLDLHAIPKEANGEIAHRCLER